MSTALQVAFLAGCLYTIVGILKLGWLTNFLSHSVISGFMSGASVIIALSQVPIYHFELYLLCAMTANMTAVGVDLCACMHGAMAGSTCILQPVLSAATGLQLLVRCFTHGIMKRSRGMPVCC